MSHQLQLQPTNSIGQGLEAQAIAEATKTEDASDDVVMDMTPYNPPLPIARIESEHSVSEYILAEKVAPDPPPPAFEFKDEPTIKVEEEEMWAKSEEGWTRLETEYFAKTDDKGLWLLGDRPSFGDLVVVASLIFLVKA